MIYHHLILTLPNIIDIIGYTHTRYDENNNHNITYT